MSESDTLDTNNILTTLDTNNILTIERLKNNGGNNKKLKKNIVRLYNCYVLSQNQNQDNLSFQIKKKLNNKIAELNELEGGGLLLILKKYLKDTIKDTIQNKIIPFINNKLDNDKSINEKIIKFINKQNFNTIISDIIETHIKLHIINFIKEQDINVGKIANDLQICFFDYCKSAFNIRGGCNTDNELFSQNKIVYNNNLEGGDSDTAGQKVKDIIENTIKDKIIPIIKNKLDETDINNIIVKLINKRNLNNDIKNILTEYILPEIIKYIDNIDFITSIKEDNKEINDQDGGVFKETLETLQTYLKDKIINTINNNIFNNIKIILKDTTKIIELIKKIKLNETIIYVIIDHIKPYIIELINEQVINIKSILIEAKICLLNTCKKALYINSINDPGQTDVALQTDDDAGKEVKKYLIDKIDNSIINFIITKLNETDIENIVIQFVNEQKLNNHLQNIFEYIKSDVTKFINDTDFVGHIKKFLNDYFKNINEQVEIRNSNREEAYGLVSQRKNKNSYK